MRGARLGPVMSMEESYNFHIPGYSMMMTNFDSTLINIITQFSVETTMDSEKESLQLSTIDFPVGVVPPNKDLQSRSSGLWWFFFGGAKPIALSASFYSATRWPQQSQPSAPPKSILVQDRLNNRVTTENRLIKQQASETDVRNQSVNLYNV